MRVCICVHSNVVTIRGCVRIKRCAAPSVVTTPTIAAYFFCPFFVFHECFISLDWTWYRYFHCPLQNEITRVKRSESYIIRNPYSVRPSESARHLALRYFKIWYALIFGSAQRTALPFCKRKWRTRMLGRFLWQTTAEPCWVWHLVSLHFCVSSVRCPLPFHS